MRKGPHLVVTTTKAVFERVQRVNFRSSSARIPLDFLLRTLRKADPCRRIRLVKHQDVRSRLERKETSSSPSFESLMERPFVQLFDLLYFSLFQLKRENRRGFIRL